MGSSETEKGVAKEGHNVGTEKNKSRAVLFKKHSHFFFLKFLAKKTQDQLS